ncbi:hypothetical protein SELMODRAFT_127276, partial [Selaginella moellendorffii]
HQAFPQNYVQLLSTTLRDSEQFLGVCFSIQQKLDSAKNLARLQVDVNHDAGFLETSPQESWAVELFVVETKKASEVEVICRLVRCVKSNIDAAWRAI